MISHPEQCVIGKTYLYEPNFIASNYSDSLNAIFSDSKIHWESNTGYVTKDTAKSPFLDIGSQISLTSIWVKDSSWTYTVGPINPDFVFLDNDFSAIIGQVFFAATTGTNPFPKITIVDFNGSPVAASTALTMTNGHRYQLSATAIILSSSSMSIDANILDLDDATNTVSLSYTFTGLTLDITHKFVASMDSAQVLGTNDYYDIIENYCISRTGLFNPCLGTDTVRTNLRRALKACALEIKTVNGYRTNINQVFDPPINLEKMNHYNCCNLIYGEERAEYPELLGNDPLISMIWEMAFEVFFQASNDPSTVIDNVLADFQKFFGNNYYVQPSGGQRTAFEVLYKGAVPYGVESNSPNFGIHIIFEVRYSIRRNDPTRLV